LTDSDETMPNPVPPPEATPTEGVATGETPVGTPDPFRTDPFSPPDPDDPDAGPARSRRRRGASRPSGAARSPFAQPTAPVTDSAAGSGTGRTKPAVTDEAAGTGRPGTDTEPTDTESTDTEPTDTELEAAAALALESQPDANAPAEAPSESAPAEAVEPAARPARRSARRPAAAPPIVTFQAPDLTDLPPRPPVEKRPSEPPNADVEPEDESTGPEADDSSDDGDGDGSGRSRRRRRGRRGRGRPRDDEETSADDGAEQAEPTTATGAAGAAGAAGATAKEKTGSTAKADSSGSAEDDTEDGESGTGSKRRRRRRRRGEGDEPGTSGGSSGGSGGSGGSAGSGASDNGNAEDEIKGVSGSTRLEAKRQRRRDSRDTSRRKVPIVTEAEYLARREAVDRVMIVRNAGERTQIAVLEDNVLVEHYVTRASSTSYAGNVYLGKVQNVLPSMEAAFVDIGKGRNGVLYAGEVNYDATGLEGKPRKIEQALKSGQSVVVQVTKDPIAHKGARLTSQISLPGRYMVYVPEGGSAGISRKLPDTERARLRSVLKKITPEDAGVIVRTAAEGASEEELARDISRLATQWEQIQKKAAKASAPALLSAEPDLVVRVVRDIFNEDFRELVVQGEEEWNTIQSYVDSVAPDLLPRLRKHIDSEDAFDAYRIDEQLLKALDRKVYLPSGGSLVFDRTEAMTVVDVNTGKFTGKGGNLEETVTRNNLEAAEELVRQLRLRDIGGIIVTDFIDMVLESNRELVLRRLTECLGRDRTKHQVAEVTSLGLVQMTRKRVGQGLLEAYSEPCPTCGGKGVHIELPSAGGAPKPAGKPIPRPPTTRPILPPEPRSVSEDDTMSPEAEVSPEIESPSEVALEGAVEGSIESTTDLPQSTRPSGDEVEVEAASAEIPTDPDVEAAEPPDRQIAAAAVGAELSDASETPSGAIEPAVADPGAAPAAEAIAPRPRKAVRRRAARRAPTTATVEPADPTANGKPGNQDPGRGDAGSTDPVSSLS
jgi:ribonuclease E